MLPEDIPLLWIVSLTVIVSLIFVLIECVCGCKKSVPKLGSNHFPAGLSSTATRSLPDLPVDPERSQLAPGTISSDVLWERGEQNNSGGDTGSELYATVGDNKNDQKSNRKYNNPLSSNGKSESLDSPSQTDDSMSPYARVKGENPYHQIKKSEHPYAQVGDKHDTSQSSRPGNSSRDADEVDGAQRSVPSPGRKSNSNDSGTERDVSRESSAQDIPAATAITGGIAASHELPYMTPPLPQNTVQQPHFSGDSQDSSKGYTSISVREPLANIMGERNRRMELVDSHYATVSDDSDEMYAAIDEPANQVYTSGSETYAQIQPHISSVRADVEPVMMSQAVTSSMADPPQPPSVNSLKHVSAHAHSRQASSSSCTSSIANVGSPKPEKRQANSPLPRPPETIDEMYAKVIKKRKETTSWSSSRDSICISDQESNPTRHSIGDMDKFTSNHDRSMKQQNLEQAKLENEEVECAHDQISGYETVFGEKKSGLGYETINSNRTPPYEQLSHDVYQEVGYEEIHKSNLTDSDPNYEELKPQSGLKYSEASYAKVNKAKKTPQKLVIAEPDYASLTNVKQMNGESNYESIGREISEPNYESVQNSSYGDSADEIPNYETVKSVTLPADIQEDMYSKVNKLKKMYK
ncbi:uncharacterized protein [Bemisia tabaci]|uniref:uncharacterized protein isoform X2 n=1 Tax=Bemisia tabaci TaxID=7038 RepID=UPI0008F9CD64|nr:PREDICTED: uncharacterized protein LOC109032215 isoform X2 [Bemisia tabaci]